MKYVNIQHTNLYMDYKFLYLFDFKDIWIFDILFIIYY